MINFSPNVTELIDIIEEWQSLPEVLKTALKNESQALFPTLISDDVEDLIDAFVRGGATAIEIETLLVAIVSDTVANIATVSKILTLATTTGTPVVISNINSNVNNIYGTVVLDQIAQNAQIAISAALLTYQSKFATIGNAIGVAAAQQILDDQLKAQSELTTLIALL